MVNLAPALFRSTTHISSAENTSSEEDNSMSLFIMFKMLFSSKPAQ